MEKSEFCECRHPWLDHVHEEDAGDFEDMNVGDCATSRDNTDPGKPV